MKNDKLVLLLSKNESYLVEVGEKDFHTRSGVIRSKDLKKAKLGNKLRSHLGKEFTVVKPNIKDILEKRAKRLPQIMMPKDIALILAYTGIKADSLVVDIGTGSGFTSIFLANYLTNGKVITYEKNEKFAKIARENMKVARLDNITLKEKDATKGIEEKNVDLITVDIQRPEKVVPLAYKALKPGGFLVVYSPTIEEVIRVNKEIKQKDFCDIKTIENLVREWQVERTTRPRTIGIMHTGWLTFARKVK